MYNTKRALQPYAGAVSLRFCDPEILQSRFFQTLTVSFQIERSFCTALCPVKKIAQIYVTECLSLQPGLA